MPARVVGGRRVPRRGGLEVEWMYSKGTESCRGAHPSSLAALQQGGHAAAAAAVAAALNQAGWCGAQLSSHRWGRRGRLQVARRLAAQLGRWNWLKHHPPPTRAIDSCTPASPTRALNFGDDRRRRSRRVAPMGKKTSKMQVWKNPHTCGSCRVRLDARRPRRNEPFDCSTRSVCREVTCSLRLPIESCRQ